MPAPHLIYFSDPMCSWCYGFSPVLEDIRRTFGRALPIRVVMGGLRPGTEQPVTEQAKQETWRDYAISQRAGVTGFPTLVAGPNEEGVYGVVTRGYASGEQVITILKEWLERIAA